jgi:adenosylhomocysteine nucleosidase
VSSVGIVAGLASEAACIDSKAVSSFAASPIAVRIAGADPVRAAAMAAELIDLGCKGLVSFGMAGGLDAGLAPGSLIAPELILGTDGNRYLCDGPWRRAAIERLGSAAVAPGFIVGSDRAILSPADKRRLREQTGAVAVDMESQAVAAVAQRARLPFLAVRAVADTAGERVPAWVLKTIDANGKPDVARVLAGLAAHPADLPALIGLGWSSRRALAALRRAAGLLGRDFGLGEPLAG